MNSPLKTVENREKGYPNPGMHAIIIFVKLYASAGNPGERWWGAVKRGLRLLGLLSMMLLLLVFTSGCEGAIDLTLDPQDLYSLPVLPVKYTELNNQLNSIISGGAEYAAPVSGTNIQPVQLVDLNGDGREEALAFFRNSADEKPLKIYIFSAKDDSYQQTAVIEGSGASIYNIVYNDLDGDGRVELLVGWRVTTELQALSVYALRNDKPEELLRSTDYVKYKTVDLNGDQKQELVVLHADDEGNGIADYYSWNPGVLTLEASARISMTMAELSGQQGRVLTGALQDGTPALFVTGVAESARAITDILVMKENEFSNIVLSAVTGVSTEISLFRSLYPMDINNDGITEIPSPVPLPTWDDEKESYQRIDWRSYGIDGGATTVLSTYHNLEDGWYFRLPESWNEQILVSGGAGMEESSVTFFARGEDGLSAESVLRITAITGANRENRAVWGARFGLKRQVDTIYVAELLEANQKWELGLTEDEVREAFSLIDTEWISSDN